MSNEPTRAYCIYNLCREKYIGLHEHESETGRITTHAPGRCDRGEHPTLASSRFLDLDARGLLDRVAEAIHDATPPEQDGGVPDVCNRYPEHETLARAILAALREPGDTR